MLLHAETIPQRLHNTEYEFSTDERFQSSHSETMANQVAAGSLVCQEKTQSQGIITSLGLQFHNHSKNSFEVIAWEL